MHATLHLDEHTSLTIDLAAPHSIAIPMDFNGPQPSAFGLSRATQAPLVLESFTTQVTRGGAVNCMQLTLWPHGNGTHTETMGHLLATPPPIGQLHSGYHVAALLSVTPCRLRDSHEHYPEPGESDDLVITQAQLQYALDALESTPYTPTALIIRTLPNNPTDKCGRDYSGTNPAYLTSEAMSWVRHTFGATHLLLDLPSVDREQDLGQLINHRTFWDVAQGSTHSTDPTRAHCTITEMILAEPRLIDGLYVLHIELPALLTDAAPSRPVLYDIHTSSLSPTLQEPHT